jgi:hypothetical protein
MAYLDLGIVCNSRLAISRRYNNLKNTIWILLHGMRLAVPVICHILDYASQGNLLQGKREILNSPIRNACVALGAHSL